MPISLQRTTPRRAKSQERIQTLLSAARRVFSENGYQRATTAQIAEDLQIAEGTVKSRLHYAVRALRLTLQEMGVTR